MRIAALPPGEPVAALPFAAGKVLRWHSPLSGRANFAHFQGPLDASRSPSPSESPNGGGSKTEGCEILTTKPTLFGFSSAILRS